MIILRAKGDRDPTAKNGAGINDFPLDRHDQFHANMRLSHISHIAAFFAYLSKVRISQFFPHKLAFSTAVLIILIFFMFLFESIFNL